MQLLSLRPINDRVRYDTTSFTDYRLQPSDTLLDLRNWLQLPPGFNPRTLALAADMRRQSNNPDQLIDAVLQFFHGQKFTYTLEPPLLGEHAVDEFLFSTQAGFCEHYSGAFVFLMRALGIPARVVTGYQGGEINPVDGYMVVRQSDAHAWAEVWLPERGWLRVDPTAAVAPERVQKSLTSVIPRTTLSGLMHFSSESGSVLGTLRLNWSALNNAWNQWVLNYSPSKQQSFIQSLGFENADWELLIVLLTLLGTGVMALVAIPLLVHRQKVDPLQALYISLCQHMARLGHPRAIHEGPRSYGQRLSAAGSALSERRKAALTHFLSLYESLKYGAQPHKLPKGALSELKIYLSECK
jgi:transglutaminase-like putative cysteine protease